MGEDVLVPLFFFLFVLGIVLGPMAIRTLYQNRERERLHQTMRLMVEKGQPVSTDLLESLNAQVPVAGPRGPRSPAADLRVGAVLLAVALGFVAFGVALGLTNSPSALGPMVGIGAFPGFIGLAFVILGVLGRNRVQP